MKLLMIYASEFTYTPNLKSLDEADEIIEGKSIKDALVGFIHIEKEDEERAKSVERSLVNNLKWGARKNNTKNIVIHSFAHLSESKADPAFSKDFLDKIEKRIANTDYNAFQTPWGYFLNLDVKAPGESLARVFKSF
jgi:hypothetical protein